MTTSFIADENNEELFFVADIVEEYCNMRTGDLMSRKSLGCQRVELKLGNDSTRFYLLAGCPSARGGDGLRGRPKEYRFHRSDLKVHSKFLRHGKMTCVNSISILFRFQQLGYAASFRWYRRCERRNGLGCVFAHNTNG